MANYSFDYYLELMLSLCGFDSPAIISIGDVIMVVIAALVLIYALYRAVVLTIWPGEYEPSHIKHAFLDEALFDEVLFDNALFDSALFDEAVPNQRCLNKGGQYES